MPPLPPPPGRPAVPTGVPAAPLSERDLAESLRNRLFDELLAAVDPGKVGALSEDQVRQKLDERAERMYRDYPDLQDVFEREAMIQLVLDEMFGYGPIEPLRREGDTSDILINGPRQVFVERRGQLRLTDVTFRDEEHLTKVIRRMVAGTNRHFDRNSPILDARLPDGSRVNIVGKPPALNGPVVSIRRFGARPLTLEDLLINKTATKTMLDFLTASVRARVNIIISGGTGSGKTTLLNALSRFIPDTERVVTVEDTGELELQQPHVVKLEAVPADPNGEGAVSMRELVRNALRMRPDRIIVGECRGGEALEALQAMNTGHDGGLVTVHANTTRDALTRLEMMIALTGTDIPLWVLRKQIAASVNLVIQVSRVPGGRRKIMAVSEVAGTEGDTIAMHDLFEYVQTGVDADGVVTGHFRATGIRPKCLKKLAMTGATLPAETFIERRLDA
jgi:pilus assembly protein CpaF